MTRVCRTKFERDDLNEAMITCGLQDSEPRDVETQPPSSHDRKIGNSDSEQGPVKQTRIWETWQVPHIFPFNCYVPTSRISECPTVVRSHLRKRVFNTHRLCYFQYCQPHLRLPDTVTLLQVSLWNPWA